MSQEPPRVVKPLEVQPPQRPRQLPDSNVQVRPKSNAGRYVLYAILSLLSLAFICSGAAFFTYRKFNADSNFGGSYSELREPIGGKLKSETRELLAKADPAVGDEAQQIAVAINEYSLDVDLSRFVMEMQRSGKSGGAVNQLTRSLWKMTLSEAISPPEFGDVNAVLSFEWLVPEVEARAVVASLSEYDSSHNVYILYLTHKEDTWSLFDWRDVLAPMNESQYWATYAVLPEPSDSSYADFSNAAYEVIVQYETSSEERIKQLMARYRGFKFPKQYINLAKDHLCAHLVNLDAKKELDTISASISAGDFLGALIYKATAAEWAGDTAKAFEYLSELNAKVGWHPRVAALAGEFAKTAEQKKLAAEWLEKSLMVVPENTVSVQSFLLLASRDQCQALVRRISESGSPSQSLLKIVESQSEMNVEQLKWLLELTRPMESLSDANEYLDVKLATEEKDFAAVVRLAPGVLSSPLLSEADDDYLAEALWTDYMTAAAKSGTLKQAFEQVADKSTFWRVLRDTTLFPNVKLPADACVECLKMIPKDHELWDEWQTPVAISKLEREGGNSSEAFELMLVAYGKHKSEINNDESCTFTGALMNELAEAAQASTRWRELENQIDSEVLFLMMASVAEPTESQLVEVIQWYEGKPGCAELWLAYFRATLANYRGEWSDADRNLVEAIALAKADSRISDDSLPPLVNQFMPREYPYAYDAGLIENWSGMRLSFAARSEKLDQLFASVMSADEFDDEWFEEFKRFCTVGSTAAMERVAAQLRLSELEKVQQTVLTMDASIAAARGDYAKSLELEMKLVRELAGDSSEQQYAIRKAGQLMLLIGNTEQLDSLRQLARGGIMAAYVECVAATLENDAGGLTRAIGDWADSDWGDQAFIANRNVLRRLSTGGILSKVTETQPVDFTWLGYTLEESVLVLSEEPAVAFESFTKFAESKSLSIEAFDASRFDQVTHAFLIAMPKAKLLVTFSETEPEAFTDNPLNGLFASEAKSQVTFHLQGFAGGQTAEQLELRTIAVDLLDGLPSAIAFQDPTQSSVYCGEGWKDRLKNAQGSTIDIGRPQEMYSMMLHAEASEPLVERNGKYYAVLDAGNVSELVPVSVEARDTPWQKAIATTLAPSILVPSIAAGVRIEVDSDY